jgi:hypothetical protein
MTTENFCYWLQGFAEVNRKAPTGEQWEIIKDHLSLVFNKVTPDRHVIKKITVHPTKEYDENGQELKFTASYCTRSPLRDDVRSCGDAGVLIDFPKTTPVTSSC